MFIFIEDSEQKITDQTNLRSIGTLWIKENELYDLEEFILSLRVKYNCWGEIKWTNVDKIHIELYKKVLKHFSELENVKFNSISVKVPASKELKDYHESDKLTYDMKMIWMVTTYNYGWYKNNLCKDEELMLIADEPLLGVGTHKDELIENFTKPRILSRYVPIKSATKAHSHIAGSLQTTDLITGLSLAHISESLYPSNFKISGSEKELRDYAVSIGLELNPIFSGRPSLSVKVNNWFHLPTGKKI